MRSYLTPEEIKKLSLEEMQNLTRKTLDPIYTSDNTKCIHSLHYSWDGWLNEETHFPDFTPSVINTCIPLWEKDGFYLIKQSVKADMIQCCFSALPDISPVKFTQRIKGRLDHAFRKTETPIQFSRKLGFRCLGENIRQTVNNYVKKQVQKSDYVDSQYKDFLTDFTQFESQTDLSEPIVNVRSRYWYNIHLVIVAADRRFPVTKKENFETIKQYIPKIANKKKCIIAHFAIMPDHIHISLKGNPEISPYDIGLNFMNNLSYVLGYRKCWNEEFYVGTFSEYSMDKLRT